MRKSAADYRQTDIEERQNASTLCFNVFVEAGSWEAGKPFLIRTSACSIRHQSNSVNLQAVS